jgi:hypothetical protein
MDIKTNQRIATRPDHKLFAGALIFIFGFLSPLFIPLVTTSDLPTGWKAVLSGLLALGIPELFMMIAVMVAGKEGFNYIRSRIFGFLKKHGPPGMVGKTRYRVGLVLFLIPLFAGWLLPYFSQIISFYEANRFLISVTGDIVLITSLFVLGGDFWDKLRSMFIYGAKASFPDKN